MSTHGTVHHRPGAASRAGARRIRWPSARRVRGGPAISDSWREAAKLIDALADNGEDSLSTEQCQILKIRWLEQAKMYDELWRGQRAFYYVVRVPIILGATTIPVLASLGVDKLITALVGLGVALLTALDSFLQLGTRWHKHSHTATDLGFEGWMFLERAGSYAGKTTRQAYAAFITHLETMNRKAALADLNAFRAPEAGVRQHRESDTS